MVQNDLTHTHGLRSNLHQFISLDIFQAFLQTHHCLRNHAGLIIRTGCTHIGKLLSIGHINYKIFLMNMLTYYLTAVNIFTWIDEEFATLLQLIDCISKRSDKTRTAWAIR